MADGITRRTFLGSAAMIGASSALGLDNSTNRSSATEGSLPARKSSFDESWMFYKGDPVGAHLPDYQSGDWTSVDLPHDWSIDGPYSKDEPCGGPGGYVPTGIAWYRKSFQLPKLGQRRISIQFDGVYQRSEVWINGRSVGMRPYGYITFSYDLTPYLRFDKESNVIAVRVDNSLQPNSRWYSGSGIYRHVWLVSTDPVHVAQWGTTIRTS